MIAESRRGDGASPYPRQQLTAVTVAWELCFHKSSQFRDVVAALVQVKSSCLGRGKRSEIPVNVICRSNVIYLPCPEFPG